MQTRSTLRTVFSGIQPTGPPHLGNYFGTLRHWVSFQHHTSPSTTSPSSTTTTSSLSSSSSPSYDRLFYSIVDLHSITTTPPPHLSHQSLTLAKWLLAFGLEREKCSLFVQSHVREHACLAWVLACRTPVSVLRRMHHWKAKAGSQDESHASVVGKSTGTAGLLTYPILQAADVLLYRKPSPTSATHVPVGQDQVQHLELARELCDRINQFLPNSSVHFPRPMVVLDPTAKKITSLRNPTKKMSKSDPDPNGTIYFSDPASTIRTKLSRAITDANPCITYDPLTRPGVSNLLTIWSLTTGHDPEELAHKCNGAKELKDQTADAVVGFVEGFRERFERVGDGVVQEVLREGGREARRVARESLGVVERAVGIGYG